ncbi:unnamed protein product [Ilex paraguariensis]|uniref:Damage-control phosphatase ARMT1-like metal-binding domain-containing protein n=1 Tax=Ilex paraguariensis TaxID=185542 RepID=A0ABC8RUT8_9AQUA
MSLKMLCCVCFASENVYMSILFKKTFSEYSEYVPNWSISTAHPWGLKLRRYRTRPGKPQLNYLSKKRRTVWECNTTGAQLDKLQVVLAANELPSINDVTYPELIEIISKLKDEHGHLVGVDTSNLLIVNSGNDLPVIDLSRVSQELAYLASDADLVILEGMGEGGEGQTLKTSEREIASPLDQNSSTTHCPSLCSLHRSRHCLATPYVTMKLQKSEKASSLESRFETVHCEASTTDSNYCPGLRLLNFRVLILPFLIKLFLAQSSVQV